jgi:hypothetical protein
MMIAFLLRGAYTRTHIVCLLGENCAIWATTCNVAAMKVYNPAKNYKLTRLLEKAALKTKESFRYYLNIVIIF